MLILAALSWAVTVIHLMIFELCVLLHGETDGCSINVFPVYV